MATFKGKNGVVKVGSNAVAEIRNWKVSEKAETVDDTVMGDDWHSRMATFKDWSGSIDVLFDDTDTDGQVTLVAGASVSLTFLMEGATSGSHSLTGTAIITGRDINESYDGICEGSITFEGNGALTEGTVSP